MSQETKEKNHVAREPTVNAMDLVIARYLKEVDAEKQDWVEYMRTLKTRYHDVKRGSSPNEEVENKNVDYLGYLPEEDKEYLLKMKKMKEDLQEIQELVATLNDMKHVLFSKILSKQKYICYLVNEHEMED